MFGNTQTKRITPLEHNTKGVFFWWFQNACADKLGNFSMVFVRIFDVIFVSQLIYVVQIFPILFKKLMAVQPMLKHPVKGGYVYCPFLPAYARRHRMASDHDKVRIGEGCLQES